MHLKSPFIDPKSEKKFLGRGIALLRPSASEEGTPPSYTHPSAPSAPRSSRLRRNCPCLSFVNPGSATDGKWGGMYFLMVMWYLHYKKQSPSAPSPNIGRPTYTYMTRTYYTATKFCMVIKLDKENFSWLTTLQKPGQNFCDTDTDARYVCGS